jgi:hypothetical protein
MIKIRNITLTLLFALVFQIACFHFYQKSMIESCQKKQYGVLGSPIETKIYIIKCEVVK